MVGTDCHWTQPKAAKNGTDFQNSTSLLQFNAGIDHKGIAFCIWVALEGELLPKSTQFQAIFGLTQRPPVRVNASVRTPLAKDLHCSVPGEVDNSGVVVRSHSSPSREALKSIHTKQVDERRNWMDKTTSWPFEVWCDLLTTDTAENWTSYDKTTAFAEVSTSPVCLGTMSKHLLLKLTIDLRTFLLAARSLSNYSEQFT